MPTASPTPSAEPTPTPAPTPLPEYEIDALPFSIGASGHYRLASDLALSGPFARGINVHADDVIVDFGGFAVTNESTFPRPVAVFVDRSSRVEIRDGRIDGFWIGVQVVDRVDAEGLPDPQDGEQHITGMEITNSAGTGIRLSGNGSTISDNVVAHTGGWVAAVGATYTHAISLFGDSLRVTDNVVYGTTNQGTPTAKETVGIGCGICPNAEIERNTFAGSAEDCVLSYGVWVSGDQPAHTEYRVAIRNNTFDGLLFGIGYGGHSSGTIAANAFLGNGLPLYSAPEYVFLTGSSGLQAIVNDAIPDARWDDVGGNSVVPNDEAWSDFEARCPALFE